MKEKDLWDFFMLTGGIDSYLAYRSIKGLTDTEFAEEEENGEGNGNNNQDS